VLYGPALELGFEAAVLKLEAHKKIKAPVAIVPPKQFTAFLLPPPTSVRRFLRRAFDLYGPITVF
jgi:hypothetical protein